MAGASRKAFEYLAQGMPLLVSDRAEWRNLFVSKGVAVACDPSSPESVCQAVASVRSSPDRWREMGRLGASLIEREWNYETSIAPVVAELERLSGR